MLSPCLVVLNSVAFPAGHSPRLIDLKRAIDSMEGLPCAIQCLSVRGMALSAADDPCTLNELGVGPGDQLLLSLLAVRLPPPRIKSCEDMSSAQHPRTQRRG